MAKINRNFTWICNDDGSTLYTYADSKFRSGVSDFPNRYEF